METHGLDVVDDFAVMAVNLLRIFCQFFLIFLILYGRLHKEAELGGLGVTNGLLAIAGMMCAATARRETPFQDGFAIAGMVLNLAVVVVTLGLFLVGAAL